MSRPAPSDSGIRCTVDRYFALAADGAIAPDDRVELLSGVIVAMSPQSARHAAAVTRARDALLAALAGRAVVREEKPLIVGTASVPEPDLAVVPAETALDEAAHPTMALLVVEVAESSLAQDRLTKAAIYALAGIPEYWIVNLRDDRVEVLRRPGDATWAERLVAPRGTTLTPVAFPDTTVQVDDLLPRPPR
jgi:Uma2 family endonuclease